MKWLQNILIGVLLSLAVIMIVQAWEAEGELGWPLNEQGMPEEGGNWMGSGQFDISPEDLHADWYNQTNGNEDWVIEENDDILRSYSAFDHSHEITIQDGGILRLDSVTFMLNTTEGNHPVTIEKGGALYITNSTFTGYEVIVEQGGELYILEGNGSSYIAMISTDSPGITISQGSIFQMKNSTMNGASTLIRVEDENAVIRGNDFSAFGEKGVCIFLAASATISGNTFSEASPFGSYAIIADEGVSSVIHDNEFIGFKYGDHSTSGRAILSYGPLEIFDNIFKRMVMDTAQDPYILYFVGVEPALHDGDPIWETNRFIGKTAQTNDERVNIFKQAWTVEVEVISSLNGEVFQGALTEVYDSSEFLVTSAVTGPSGGVSFAINEYVVTASDDGETGDSDKEETNLDPYDFVASLEGESASSDERSVPSDLVIQIQLGLIHHDVTVSGIEFPDPITEGVSFQVECSLTNLGIIMGQTLGLSVVLEANDESWSHELGNEQVIMDGPDSNIFFDVTIPNSPPVGMYHIKATTLLDNDQNLSNDEFRSSAFSINRKPLISIDSPVEGAEVRDVIIVDGSALDDGSVDLVQIGILGTWYDAQDIALWHYSFDTTSFPNGPLTISARAVDDLEIYSEVVLVNLTVVNSPKITITSPSDGSDLLGTSQVTLVGSTTRHQADIVSVTISIDGGEEMAATDVNNWNQWTFELRKDEVDLVNPLSDGEHTILATVIDADDLTGSAVHTYIVHSTDPSTDPTCTATDPPLTISTHTWIEGTAQDDYQIVSMEYSINGGSWLSLNEVTGEGSSDVTWRIMISPDSLLLGANSIVIRTFDHDVNITTTVQLERVPPAADLSISDVILLDGEGNQFSGEDIVVGNKINFIISVDVTTEHPLPLVGVRVTVRGRVGGMRTRENVTGDFDISLSISISESMLKSQNDMFEVIVDPANIIDESNETNNEFTGTLPIIDDDPESNTTLIDLLLEPIGPLPLIAYVVIVIALIGIIAAVRKPKP